MSPSPGEVWLADLGAWAVLGLRKWRIRRALDAYQRGEGSLAFAAHRAGVSLREMIPLAYAHGVTPRSDVEAGDVGL